MRERSTLPILIAGLAAWLALRPGGNQSLGAARQPASPLPVLTYTKTLKGSVPEFLKVSVNSEGVGAYEGRKLADAPSPRSLKLSAATTQRLFDLAHQLGNFRSLDLESHRKVANLGSKTFTYEAGGEQNRVEFNYTLNREAQQLSELFEKIASVEEHLAALEFAIKYDHLGLPRELLQIQIDLDNRALADPELLVPTLEKIVQNSHFLHLAQARAENILKRLQTSN